MKKNDLDFIRDKIENSGVNAPADMDESYAAARLDGVQPDAVPDLKLVETAPKKRRYGFIAGIAAAIAVVIALSVTAAVIIGRMSSVAPSVNEGVPLRTFKSYDEVKLQAQLVADRYRYYSNDSRAYDSMEFSSGSTGSSSGSSKEQSAGSNSSDSAGGSYSETYRQVEGVDEADIVKTDGKYLYVVSNNDVDAVDIFSATDSPEHLASVYPDNTENPNEMAVTDDEDSPDVFVEEIFVYDGKLIVVCVIRGELFNYDTTAYVYDVSDVNHIKLTDQLYQSGYYSASRIVADTLYLISEHSVYSGYADIDIPLCYRGAEEKEIPIDCVYSVENPTDNEMLVVGGFGLRDGSKDVQTSAIIGSVQDIYCNESNLFIYTTKWRNEFIENDGEDGGSRTGRNDPDDIIKTDIYKVSLTDGIAFTAYGEIMGYLDSRYSLDEKDGYLRVAATVVDVIDRETNALYILDGNLNEVGSVTGFAEDESIRAVRYVGDVAYVITYEQTDPLFVIDVSDPENPAILSEVKIDGFSTMLVPVDENTVLGLGVYTEDREGYSMQIQSGFKLALFDVSDKLHPQVLDERVYPDEYSEVMGDPRALVYNPDRGDYLIPMNHEYIRTIDNKDKASGGEDDTDVTEDDFVSEIYGGALNFKVENGKIVEIDRPELELGDDDNNMINRCLYVGNVYYMISNGYYHEVKVYAAQYK